MIRLSNGYEFTFCVASGALGFDGDGYFWEQPFRWLGLLRPKEFTIIAKTVTFEPRAGNLVWWHPWTCVKLIPGGAVNSVGLTNIGYKAWMRDCFPRARRRGYNMFASIQPVTPDEAAIMAKEIDLLDQDTLKAIEINLSCPNTKDSYDPVAVVKAVRQNCTVPLLAKLGYDSINLVPLLQDYVEVFSVINTVPWNKVFPDRPSPLACHGLEGGVSGSQIKEIARASLQETKRLTSRPVKSGGGMDSFKEVMIREYLGADAFDLGTIFLRSPWEPNRIVRQYFHEKAAVAVGQPPPR